MKVEEALMIYLTSVRDEIFVEQKRLGMQASGFSEANTKPVVKKSEGYIKAPAYLFTNFKGIGRKPGTMPPVKDILAWIKIKHLDLNAWAVAKTIQKKGTRVYYNRRRGIDLKAIKNMFKSEFKKNIKAALTKKKK